MVEDFDLTSMPVPQMMSLKVLVPALVPEAGCDFKPVLTTRNHDIAMLSP